MNQIIPTIFTPDINKVKDKLTQLHGLVDWIHLDIMDGKYVKNTTVQLKDLQNIRQFKNYKVGVHLMVKNPLKQLKYVKNLGASQFIAQIEEIKNQKKFVNKILQQGIKPGIALDLNTPINTINKNILPQINIILIMLVKAGWGGQELQYSGLEKVKKLKKLKEEKGYHYQIAVDGGINKKTIKKCINAGADILSAGSAVWENNRVEENLRELNSHLQGDTQ